MMVRFLPIHSFDKAERHEVFTGQAVHPRCEQHRGNRGRMTNENGAVQFLRCVTL